MLNNIRSKKTMLFDLLILFVISFSFYFIFMGSYMLLSPDEGLYAGVAQEMLMRGEWITPFQNGIVFMDKPILFYWLEIISMKSFGINEWAVRLVPMCLGVFGIMMTYVAGMKLFNRRTALIASAILMTAPFYFLLSHYANMDLTVAVLISTVLWFILIALQCHDSRQRRLYCYLAYVVSALAVLTKGLIGLVFPIMIVGAWIVLFNQWRQLKKMHLVMGAIIFLALTLPWYLAMQHNNPSFFHYFFIFQHIDRYIEDTFNMANPFYYYGVVFCLGFFPWVVFFPQSLSFIAKRLYAYKQSMVEWFLVLWVVIIFIFFSIPTSKVPSYILPIFPPMAMLLALYFDRHWNDLFSKRSIRWSLIALSIFIISMIIAIVIALVKPLPFLLPSRKVLVSSIVFLTLVLFCGYLVKRRKKDSIYFFSFFFISVMFFISIFYSQLKAITPQTRKEVALLMREALKSNGIPVMSELLYNQAFPFYVGRPLYIISSKWHDPTLLKQDGWQGELAIGAQASNNWKYLIDMRTLHSLWRTHPNVVIYLEEDKLPILQRWAAHGGKKYRIIVKVGRFYLLTNATHYSGPLCLDKI